MTESTGPDVEQEALRAARALLADGDFAGALRVLDSAAERDADGRPGRPTAMTMRAFALERLGNRAAAVAAVQAVLRAHPGDRDASLLFVRLLGSDRPEFGPVIDAARRGLVVNPDCAPLWHALATMPPADARDGGHDAPAALLRARAAAPADPRIRRALSASLAERSTQARFAGNLARAVDLAGRAIEADPSLEGAWAARMFANLCREDLTPEDAYAEALAAGRAIVRNAPAPRHASRPGTAGPVSLGILAATLDVSSVWHFLVPLLDRHDPAAVAITLYDDAPHALRLDRARVRTVALAGLDPAAVAGRVAAAGHDAVLDVMGYGQYGSRLGVLAARPAPVALTGIGYPGTLGLDAVGYKLGDRLIHPEGGPERLHERPLRLPYMLCYRPPAHAPEAVRRPPGAPMTFGSFNQLSKIGPTCLEAWRLALIAVPEARLLVKRREIAGRERWFHDRFAAHGLPMDRVSLEGGEAGHGDHLARYADIDIALDTYPYNGTTTTCEALWMGVPVVSLVGDRESSRTGLSLLTAAGRPADAVATPAAFAGRVAALARDAAGRADWRVDARRQLRASALLDETGYARSFEAALTAVVRGGAAGPSVQYQA